MANTYADTYVKMRWYAERDRIAVVSLDKKATIVDDLYTNLPTGSIVRIYGAKIADHFSANNDSLTELPEQFHEAIVYKAIANGYETPPNLNPEMAMYFKTQADTIAATFENFTTDDLDSGGYVLKSGGNVYDDTLDTSIDNYPGIFYYDETKNNRVYFKVNSSNFIQADGDPNEGLNGNIGSPGDMITINSTTHSGTYVIFESTLIEASYTNDGILVQSLGEVWLATTIDDPVNGIDFEPSMNDVAATNGTWSMEKEQWTDADITINKAVFWERDKIVPTDT